MAGAFQSAAPSRRAQARAVPARATGYGEQATAPSAAATAEPKPDPFATKEQYQDGFFAKLMIWQVGDKLLLLPLPLLSDGDHTHTAAVLACVGYGVASKSNYSVRY